MNYEKQAKDFLEKTESKIDIQFIKHDKHFPEDKGKRDIYEVTLSRKSSHYGVSEYVFNFGNSIVNSVKPEDMGKTIYDKKGFRKGMLKRKAPSAYDILCCLQKYNPDTFQNFCADYGYNTDSISAKKTYDAVMNEYLELSHLYNSEELELMAEIQ